MGQIAHHNLQSSTPAKRTTPVLSPELKWLLEGERKTEKAVDELIKTPALRAEAAAVLPHLEREAKRAAGEEGVQEVVGLRFVTYPQPERTDAEWAAWWNDYFDVCADLPRGALEAGMLAWVSKPDAEFLPKPGQLRDLALRSENKAAVACFRARRAAEYRDPAESTPGAIKSHVTARTIAAPTMRAMPDPEAVKAVKKMREDYNEQVAVYVSPVEKRPPVSGPVDGRGLTQAMREAIARRSGAQ